MKLKHSILSAALALLLVGCSSAPEDAVYGMYDALEDGDIEMLTEYATDTTVGLLTMGAMMKCPYSESKYNSEEKFIQECIKASFDGISVKNVEITDQTEKKATAIVYLKNKNGQESKEKLSLIKEDDDWKVNISK